MVIMSSKKVTIKHIAEAAGVSFSTVGKALHNDPLVNKETMEKILRIAKELNYYPNLLAKGLRVKKTETIGVIFNDLKNPVYSEIIKAIEEILNNLNFTMLLCDSNFQEKLEKKNIITMLSKDAAGIIISPVNEKSENIKLIVENNLKAVFLDCTPDYPGISYVYVNHESAAFLATEYLIKNGHKNILLLNGPSELSSSQHFLKGYLKALSYYDLKPADNLIKSIDISIASGCKNFKTLYKYKKDTGYICFTAIVTLSDLIAMGVYKAVRELSLKIPGDFSIIGYDNIFCAEALNPPLTTTHYPKTITGRNSINMLLDQINNKENGLKKITIEPRLVKRDSVKKIN
jgi:LacI family transcriptional regulator